MYKSASKRKAHILKNHPGAELPPSIRKLRPAAPGEPDPMLSTHTQLTGTIATAPVCCPHCAKQYSSKVAPPLATCCFFSVNFSSILLTSCTFVLQTKMVQHIRKKHPEFAQLANTIPAPLTTAVISSTPAVISADGATAEAVVVRNSAVANLHLKIKEETIYKTDLRTGSKYGEKNPFSLHQFTQNCQ